MRKLLIAILAIVASSLALAHGPSRLKVTQSITVNAPPAKVWATIRDFNGLPAWHPAIAGSTVTAGNDIGSRRTLTLKGGGEVIEELEEFDETRMLMKYRMKSGALPVTNYAAALQVKPGDDGKAVVEWRGGFYRGYPNNDPPPDRNDEAAEKAITGVYQSGLANLKALVEQ